MITDKKKTVAVNSFIFLPPNFLMDFFSLIIINIERRSNVFCVKWFKFFFSLSLYQPDNYCQKGEVKYRICFDNRWTRITGIEFVFKYILCLYVWLCILFFSIEFKIVVSHSMNVCMFLCANESLSVKQIRHGHHHRQKYWIKWFINNKSTNF